MVGFLPVAVAAGLVEEAPTSAAVTPDSAAEVDARARRRRAVVFSIVFNLLD